MKDGKGKQILLRGQSDNICCTALSSSCSKIRIPLKSNLVPGFTMTVLKATSFIYLLTELYCFGQNVIAPFLSTTNSSNFSSFNIVGQGRKVFTKRYMTMHSNLSKVSPISFMFTSLTMHLYTLYTLYTYVHFKIKLTQLD